MTTLYVTKNGYYSHTVDHVKGDSVPLQSTLMAPPIVTVGKIARYIKGNWLIVNERPEGAGTVVEEPIILKNKYTWPQFYKALTKSAKENLVDKARTTKAAGAILEEIKLEGLDFNKAADVVLIGRMVTAQIVDSDERDSLIG